MADAGASQTFPQQADKFRKNAYLVINGRPCKIVDVSISKTGRTGTSQCHFFGVDLFTDKKYDLLVPANQMCDGPYVTKTDYTLVDIDEEGCVSLVDADGNTRNDLKLPSGTVEQEEFARQMVRDLNDGNQWIVCVMKAMNEEMIVSKKIAA